MQPLVQGTMGNSIEQTDDKVGVLPVYMPKIIIQIHIENIGWDRRHPLVTQQPLDVAVVYSGIENVLTPEDKCYRTSFLQSFLSQIGSQIGSLLT